ncbi:MAG: hypothetical protein ACRD4B_09285, partial [Acidobacteriota bacterium]
DLTHQISLLATIIDNFGVRRTNETKGVGTIKALENWLADSLGGQEARRITEPFARVRDLRNQYPVHDQFESGTNGSREAREAVRIAEAFFGFREVDDVTAQWKKVCDAFKRAVAEVEQVVLNIPAPQSTTGPSASQ